MSPSDRFGPFADGLTPVERTARLRAMRALSHILTGRRGQSLTDTLRAAESDPDALEQAAVELGRLPSLDRRRLLASFAVLHVPPRTTRSRT